MLLKEPAIYHYKSTLTFAVAMSTLGKCSLVVRISPTTVVISMSMVKKKVLPSNLKVCVSRSIISVGNKLYVGDFDMFTQGGIH